MYVVVEKCTAMESMDVFNSSIFKKVDITLLKDNKDDIVLSSSYKVETSEDEKNTTEAMKECAYKLNFYILKNRPESIRFTGEGELMREFFVIFINLVNSLKLYTISGVDNYIKYHI